MCVCLGGGGWEEGRITCEWLEKNNRGRAWRGGSGNFPIKLSKSPSSPRQANDTAAPKLSASRSYKNLQVFNFLPIPDTSKGLQGGIGRDFFLIFFFLLGVFFPPLGSRCHPPSPQSEVLPPSLPPSSFSSQASEAAAQGGAGGLGAPLFSLPSPPSRPASRVSPQR